MGKLFASLGVLLVVIFAFLGIRLNINTDNVDRTFAEDKTKAEIVAADKLQDKMIQSVPLPNLQTSSERTNVKRRAELFNNEDKISYIYLVNYGRVMAFFTVRGKVSSLQSYMVPNQKIVTSRGTPCYDVWGCGSGTGYVIDAPDIDGTYGENVDGIFFFTTEGAYVEWRGDYMMSDQPLQLTTQPELVRVIE
jgi:hypothetical protein